MSAPTTPLKWSPKKKPSTSNSARSPAAERSPSGNSKGKMRAIFCDVVVEDVHRSSSGWELPPAVQAFLPCLGTTLDKRTSSPAFPTTPSRAALGDEDMPHRPPDLTRLRNLMLELESTEETYVRRLRILHRLYASPLREFARNRDTEILSVFDAKMMFGNIEAILPANEAFLHDLKASLHPPNGYHSPEHWAQAMLRHLQHFSTIYPAYILNLDSAKARERELRGRSTAFRNFMERTRASAGEGTDNCSLESLLIEAAQRIPRYRLLLKGILKEVSPADPARAAMVEAVEFASSIAALDENEDTRRAAALFGLGRAIDGFPARITNSNRYFVDCIDVVDKRLPSALAGAAPGSGYSTHTDDLHCTLFLFNDRLLIAKRNDADGTGRQIVGLNNINKLVQEMQGGDAGLSRSRSPMKARGKSMRYRGDFDLGDVTANDLSEIVFSLFLDKPPNDLTDRWNGRPLRHFEIIKPERPEDKSRFLSNVWQCIAQIKTDKNGPKAMILKQSGLSVYWNIYDKRAYLAEPRKAKMALQVSEAEDFQELTLANVAPCVVAHAVVSEDGSCDQSLRIKGMPTDGKYGVIRPSALVKQMVEAALHYRLYDMIPSVPGGSAGLDRQSSKASTASRPLSASSSRPKSMLDFMLSPSNSVSSPRRTLSKNSKASTLDSGIGSQRSVASIFSDGHASAKSASTTHTSVNSHEVLRSPYKRPATSGGPAQHASASKANNAQSSGELLARRSMSHMSTSSARQEQTAHRPLDTDDKIEMLDQASLARSRSDGQLYQSSSEQSLASERRLARSNSTQSMKIDEEEERLDDEHALPPRTPPRDCLSPPLQRSGTLSRPFGPRQLGSKSPVISPRPTATADSRSRTPSDDDDDNPFVQNGLRSSTGRKRVHDDEGGDDSSVSSKRALRAVNAAQEDGRRPSPRGSDPKSRGKARDHGRTAAVARSAAAQDYTTDLQRTGSLPRSPHTRSLYQQSRPAGSADPTPSRQPPSAVKGPSSSRIPRKPAPNGGDIEMELSLVRKQSIAERATHATERAAYQTEVEHLRQQLKASQDEAAKLKEKLDTIEADHTEYLATFEAHALEKANEKITDYMNSTDAEIARLNTENHKLRNEKRALQALLKRQASTS